MLKLCGLEPVWDKAIVDEEKTTADFTVGTPVKKEAVLIADKPWEQGMAHYNNVVFDGEKYRLYYVCHPEWVKKNEHTEATEGTTIEILNTFVCYAESLDGLHWEKPSLGMCEYNGSKDNNIILRSIDKTEPGGFFDNFFVFIDTNPDCDPKKKYKATAYANLYRFSGYSSADGINFNLEAIFDVPGKFDTLNVCWWDEKIKKYVSYVRDFHNIPENGDLNAGIRDARRTESEDFLHWSVPELITFNNTEDYPIYTNQVMRYYRNPDIYIGFPTRYEERPDWSDSFDELCGREERLAQVARVKRYGLTVTDCVFMSSRDGLHWDKIDEAIFSPGMEFERNWIYGNCYPAYFMLETPTEDGENKEISMLLGEYYAHSRLTRPAVDIVYRYTIRRDGFALYRAKYKGAKFVTKQFIFEGDELRINFSTSAKGSVYITLRDEDGNEAKTGEIFGDSDHRRVKFDKDISAFANKPVTLEFDMKDAKLYAFEFIKNKEN